MIPGFLGNSLTAFSRRCSKISKRLSANQHRGLCLCGDVLFPTTLFDVSMPPSQHWFKLAVYDSERLGSGVRSFANLKFARLLGHCKTQMRPCKSNRHENASSLNLHWMHASIALA
jgi:hypothetical protein